MTFGAAKFASKKKMIASFVMHYSFLLFFSSSSCSSFCLYTRSSPAITLNKNIVDTLCVFAATFTFQTEWPTRASGQKSLHRSLCACTYQNPSFSKLSIEHAAAIRIPSSFMTAARSIPLSSASSICRKSPTLCDTGRSANWHFSFRLGSGTVTCGNPLIYLIVTSVERTKQENGTNKWN